MKRRQRVLVVAAGVLCQITIAAIALWLWNLSAADTWLHTGSYLLMTAALFTVAINLNPLSKFDGYYLAVVLSGINNLRDRSFKFYTNLLTAKPIQEKPSVRGWLALYGPFSFAYLLFVFRSSLTAKNQEIEAAKQQQRDIATDLQNETSSQQTIKYRLFPLIQQALLKPRAIFPISRPLLQYELAN